MKNHIIIQNRKELYGEFGSLMEKYSFFGDPIFLTYPNRIPTQEELLSNEWKKSIKYPLVDEVQPYIPEFRRAIRACEEIVLQKDSTSWLSIEYKKRFSQMRDLLEIIEDFYHPDEQKKFDVITDYFGVDKDYCISLACQDRGVSSFFSELADDGLRIHLPNQAILSADEIRQYFIEALEFLNIKKHWNVEISDTAMAIVHGDFTPKGGTIFIPSSYTMHPDELTCLIIHEIDAHARQLTSQKEKECLLTSSLRMPYSEEITEGLALFLEYGFDAYVFGVLKYEKTYPNFQRKIQLLQKEISQNTFIRGYKGKTIFRTFRGFFDIENFINTKDLVYIQGLNRFLETYQKYGGAAIESAYHGMVNREYIERIAPTLPSASLSLQELIRKSSAFYILTKYFYDKK